MPIKDKFQSEDPYILTDKMRTADNNQTALNTALNERDFLQATNVNFQQTGLTGTSGATSSIGETANRTVGSALGGAGINPDIPCFTGDTLILMADGSEKPIGEIKVSAEEYVMAFDKNGELHPKLVIGKWEHLVWEYLNVSFEDNRMTRTTAQHRYWIGGEDFKEISHLEKVQHWNGEKWESSNIVSKIPVLIEPPVVVFNLTVKTFHNYIANGDAVSNLKPLDPL